MPSINFLTTSFLFLPLATTIRVLALKASAIPIEMAYFGTSSFDSKNLEFASMVASANFTIDVLLFKNSPGSLKARWPFGPRPRTCKSLVPKSSNNLLYSSAYFSSFVSAFGRWVFSFLIFTWLNKFSFIKYW